MQAQVSRPKSGKWKSVQAKKKSHPNDRKFVKCALKSLKYVIYQLLSRSQTLSSSATLGGRGERRGQLGKDGEKGGWSHSSDAEAHPEKGTVMHPAVQHQAVHLLCSNLDCKLDSFTKTIPALKMNFLSARTNSTIQWGGAEGRDGTEQ